MSSANDATDDTSSKQAQVRYATLRVSNLIRHCKLICSATDSFIAIWATDANKNGRININELVYIQKGPAPDLRICQFPSSYTAEKSLAEVAMLSLDSYGIIPVILVSECHEIQLKCYDSNLVVITSPPWTRTRFINITFKLIENGLEHQYQINSALHSWAGNLLGTDGQSIVSDDD